MVSFEVASFSSFRDFPIRSFCDGEVGDFMNAICSRPEVADDAVSCEDVDTIRCNVNINVWVAIFSSFRENRNQSFL